MLMILLLGLGYTEKELFNMLFSVDKTVLSTVKFNSNNAVKFWFGVQASANTNR